MNRGEPEKPFKQTAADSPFAIVPEAETEVPAAPFTWGKDQWPFPEEDEPEGFGFEAPAAASQVREAPVRNAEPQPFTSPAWQREPVAAATAVTPPPPKEGWSFSRFEAEPAAPAVPVQPAPAAVAPPPAEDPMSDSGAIRQLELKAIFGLDREIDANELLDRCRTLPGVRNLARIRSEDVVTLESLKGLLSNLGFGSGAFQVQIGGAPLEFVREGGVILAVQTAGGFAPGVRETLIIAARELAKMA